MKGFLGLSYDPRYQRDDTNTDRYQENVRMGAVINCLIKDVNKDVLGEPSREYAEDCIAFA